MNARLKEIELNSDDTVKCYRLADGSTIEGDLYVSAMPGNSLWKSSACHVAPCDFSCLQHCVAPSND